MYTLCAWGGAWTAGVMSLPQDVDGRDSNCHSSDNSSESSRSSSRSSISSSSSSGSSREGGSSNSSSGGSSSSSCRGSDSSGRGDDQERIAFRVSVHVKSRLSVCSCQHGLSCWEGGSEPEPAGHPAAASQGLQAEPRACNDHLCVRLRPAEAQAGGASYLLRTPGSLDSQY